MNIIEASMKHRQITIILTLLLVGAGIFSLFHMSRREDPKMTIRQGLIIMPYPGANSEQVEEQVTKKVEQYLFRYDEVKKNETESITSDGLSIIKVELHDRIVNRDKFWSKVRHGLYELKATKLPEGVMGPIINSDFGDTVALLISVESNRHSYTELKDAVEILEDAIRSLPEVSKLKRYGEQKEQLYVSCSSERLSQYGVGFPQVLGVLKSMNSINYAGEIQSGKSEAPIHATDLYDSEEQLKNQQVMATQSGEIVRIKDIADVKRRYEEPDSYIRVNGNKVLMLSVEMQEGYNIVAFGKKVDNKLADAKKLLPSDIIVKKIADQPLVVNDKIQYFFIEFLIAIVAVIIVTMILLPLRIASVAALAIPITVMITFGILEMFKVELQQMTLAGLIVVLGMVVDNAIVVVDDYVEKLDIGLSPWEAGWKSATDLFLPVLTATVAIICAFMPVAFLLSGNGGEFLYTLPVSVTIAIIVSLFTALFLIPILCITFIKTGLRANQNKKKRPSVLDKLQNIYNATLLKAFQWPKTTILLGILSIAGTFLISSQLKTRMFPAMDRNQFCLEVYMTQGTNLETTDKAVQKIETILLKDDRIVEVASFIGCSSPRFYLTYAPQPPDVNYAQLLINTVSSEATQELIDELIIDFNNFIPDGEIFVKQLRAAPPVDAAVEVRIMGNNLRELKRVGEEVKGILKNTNGTNFVRTNYREDYYGISVEVDEEVANRLGLTNQSIAQMLAVSFKGAPISTLWEGDNPIDIVFRLDEESREDFDDIGNIYVTSPLTGARVPLRQVAKLVPEWQTGKIVRRNGIRTLTVRSEAQMERLPNDILKDIRPIISQIDLPPGMRIEYGGELEDQQLMMEDQSAALLTSLILIFLVLMFQFKEIKKVLIIMATIPLSWFGAVLGLYITGYAFCSTAFLGIISLCGLVVRNGIILMDYGDHLLNQKKDMKVKEAAMEAGRRRMRPVFLTSVAAAAGVIPMVIGGSPLWAPMASVLSVGLIVSMVLTLIIVPVLYWLVMKPKKQVESQQSKFKQDGVALSLSEV